jgi:hypothetical protein
MNFLSSAEVNERTDDDRTLVLATRRRSAVGSPAGELDAESDGL